MYLNYLTFSSPKFPLLYLSNPHHYHSFPNCPSPLGLITLGLLNHFSLFKKLDRTRRSDRFDRDLPSFPVWTSTKNHYEGQTSQNRWEPVKNRPKSVKTDKNRKPVQIFQNRFLNLLIFFLFYFRIFDPFLNFNFMVLRYWTSLKTKFSFFY